MRIGELSSRTGASTRMLRYYEEQHLLTARRSANGYRSFTADDVERVGRIRSLLGAGLPARFVRAVLDMGLEGDAALPGWSPTCTAAFAEMLRTELGRLEEQVECLTRSREAVRHYLGSVTVLTASDDTPADDTAA